tara:strand:+ start:23031 stop:24527 length:1497 start_codon:yes stop_codon:yes gene_type:complete
MAEIQDIFIIGGGINGTGIAADAAGRGLSVILCEQNDLGSGTSSASTKLVHGGLRYLEHYKFKLVRKALREREILLKKAPHIIKPIRFLLPHNGMRPEWFVRLGLFIYDHLGGRKILPPTKTRSLKKGLYAGILEKTYHKAFEYSDCWVDDSRLVILNACSARDSGAEILPKHKCISAIRKNGSWEIILKNRSSGENRTLKAKVLINAAGPWLDKVISNVLDQHKPSLVRLVKGSHIIVNKLYNHDRSYVFQGNKGRIIFAIPYQENFTLIGTTDQDFKGDLSNVHIDNSEVEYLCNVSNEYFKNKISTKDVIGQYAGVRPLYDDGASTAQEATRDFVLKYDKDNLFLNIIGGKITTYRVLAEKTLNHLTDIFPKMKNNWTVDSTLPGGNFSFDDFDFNLNKLSNDYPFINESLLRRYFENYGTLSWVLLNNINSIGDLGKDFGHGLYEKEVEYLFINEWAKCAEDILWRRTKLGLHMNTQQIENIDGWFTEKNGILN